MFGQFISKLSIYKHTTKHRNRNTHAQATVGNSVLFCHLPAIATPVLNVNPMILLYLGEKGEWWGEQKHPTTKKVLHNAAIFAASNTNVSFSSLSSSSLAAFVLPLPHSHSFTEYHLALPLNPPLWVHTVRCTLKRLEETKWEGCYYNDDTSTALLFQGNSGRFSFIFNMLLCLNMWEVATRLWHVMFAQQFLQYLLSKLHNFLESLSELGASFPIWELFLGDWNNYTKERKSASKFPNNGNIFYYLKQIF